MMRAISLLAVVVAVAAIPHNEFVPEDTLVQYDTTDYENAKAHIQTLMESGKSDKECRDLATASKKAIEDDNAADQKILDALPDGSNCKNEGQGLANTNKAALAQASQAESDAKKKLDKAKAVNVDFGSMPYNTLTPGQCGVFFNHANYKAAKNALDAAQKAHDKAKGAKVAALKAYDDSVAAAAKAKAECLCRTKKKHDEAWASVKKTAPKGGIDWKTAHNVLCVLDGTPASKCKVPPQPKLVDPKLTADAQAMDSSKCKVGVCELGYTHKAGDIGGWGKVNGVGGGVKVSNCDGCGALCSAQGSACGSYECSPTELKCNLNSSSKPTQGDYKNYAFCAK